MTAQPQTMETLRQACADTAKLPPNATKKQAADANKPGSTRMRFRLVKTAQESADWSAADRAALADMLEGSLPAVIAGWDAKEQRKKLQLAKLRPRASAVLSSPLPIARYRFSARVTDELQLPHYAGPCCAGSLALPCASWPA